MFLGRRFTGSTRRHYRLYAITSNPWSQRPRHISDTSRPRSQNNNKHNPPRIIEATPFAIVHTDQGTAFHNESVTELLRLSGVAQSLTTTSQTWCPRQQVHPRSHRRLLSVGRTLPHQEHGGGRDSLMHAPHTAFHNELVTEQLRLSSVEQSLTAAYSKEENAIVERNPPLRFPRPQSLQLRPRPHVTSDCGSTQ